MVSRVVTQGYHTVLACVRTAFAHVLSPCAHGARLVRSGITVLSTRYCMCYRIRSTCVHTWGFTVVATWSHMCSPRGLDVFSPCSQLCSLRGITCGCTVLSVFHSGITCVLSHCGKCGVALVSPVASPWFRRGIYLRGWFHSVITVLSVWSRRGRTMLSQWFRSTLTGVITGVVAGGCTGVLIVVVT